MPGRLSAIVEAVPQLIASATLRVDTRGAGFTDITDNAANFIENVRAGEGALLIYLRHTSASLTIQENADPDVQADLIDRARSARARKRGLDTRCGRPGRYAGARQSDAQRRITACARHRRKTRARHLAGHLSRRTSSQAAQPGSDVSVHRQSEMKTPRNAGRSGKMQGGGCPAAL